MKLFNINNLSKDVKDKMDPFRGFTTSFLLAMTVGSWFSTHIEESDQLSINYLHTPDRTHAMLKKLPDAKKIWILIPSNQSHHLEQLLDLLVPKKYKHCSNFIAHRHILTDPQLLKDFGIEHYIGAQNEGEITVVLPRAYHTGV